MRSPLPFLALIGTAWAYTPTCPLPEVGSTFTGIGTHTSDGDTFDMGCVRVRTGDWDSPERGQPGYQEAKDDLARIVMGQSLSCVSGAGARNPRKPYSHGRVVAICTQTSSGLTVGALMLAAGAPSGGN